MENLIGSGIFRWSYLPVQQCHVPAMYTPFLKGIWFLPYWALKWKWTQTKNRKGGPLGLLIKCNLSMQLTWPLGHLFCTKKCQLPSGVNLIDTITSFWFNKALKSRSLKRLGLVHCWFNYIKRGQCPLGGSSHLVPQLWKTKWVSVIRHNGPFVPLWKRPYYTSNLWSLLGAINSVSSPLKFFQVTVLLLQSGHMIMTLEINPCHFFGPPILQ